MRHDQTPPDKRGALWWLREHAEAERAVTSAWTLEGGPMSRERFERELDRRMDRLELVDDLCGSIIEALAAELNLSPEVYASYEENGKDVPISVIYEIANKFKVDFTEIVTGQSAKLDTWHLIRRGGGKIINRNPEYHFEDLAYRYANKVMQPLLVTLEPSDAVAKLITHSGQEFNMVLEGTVIVTLGDKDFVLNPGDSIYFNPTIPHGQRCGGDVKARFLTVIAE